MQLQNLQHEFAEAVLSDDTHLSFILPAQNIRIYQNQALSQLIECLRNTYPLIVKLVGDDFFRVTAKAYIKQYHSRSGDLNEYGAYFSHFLAGYQAVKDLIYLAEVAQFEWTCHLLSTAGTHGPFDPHLLKNVSPEQYDQLHFVLHPAAKVMKFYYPILRIIDLCETKIDENIDLSEAGVDLLIIRRQLDISLLPLTPADFIFLSSLQDNHSVSDALEAALNEDPHFSLDQKLTAWIQDGTIVDCYFS